MSNPTQNPSIRKRIKQVRGCISHVFPGIVRIVYDPGSGTLKTSFAETKLSIIVKHRALYAKILERHGFPIDSNTLDYSIGTWKVGKGSLKKLFHVLTFTLPIFEGRRVLCTFIPLWKRVIRLKTDEEIDKEFNLLLSNRKALIKRLGINTHIHQ